MTKHAFFLGGTKGLGLALAKGTGQEWRVVLAGRTAYTCELVECGWASALRIDLEAETIRLPEHLGPFDLIVWSAGIYQHGPFTDISSAEIRRMCRNHIEGPACVLSELFRQNRASGRPCHLVVIGSSSAYRSRVDETFYGMMKAAKAQFARNLGIELPRDLPGSKVLLVNPGGMATPFWDGRGRDVSDFMDPVDVARVIWEVVRAQTAPFQEIQILRQPDRKPKVEYGPRLPQ